MFGSRRIAPPRDRRAGPSAAISTYRSSLLPYLGLVVQDDIQQRRSRSPRRSACLPCGRFRLRSRPPCPISRLWRGRHCSSRRDEAERRAHQCRRRWRGPGLPRSQELLLRSPSSTFYRLRRCMDGGRSGSDSTKLRNLPQVGLSSDRCTLVAIETELKGQFRKSRLPSAYMDLYGCGVAQSFTRQRTAWLPSAANFLVNTPICDPARGALAPRETGLGMQVNARDRRPADEEFHF
jgi:hypothetical protein